MTNEQAIYLLKGMRGKAIQSESEALDMAIEALNFVSEHHQSNIETYAHDMGVSLEQAERELRVEELSCSEKPNNSDLISRQDAIDAVDVKCLHRGIVKGIQEIIEDLPSAKPKRKKGEWIWQMYENIYRCSVCETETHVDECMEEPIYNYCPYCGSYNGGEQDDTD